MPPVCRAATGYRFAVQHQRMSPVFTNLGGTQLTAPALESMKGLTSHTGQNLRSIQITDSGWWVNSRRVLERHNRPRRIRHAWVLGNRTVNPHAPQSHRMTRPRVSGPGRRDEDGSDGTEPSAGSGAGTSTVAGKGKTIAATSNRGLSGHEIRESLHLSKSAMLMPATIGLATTTPREAVKFNELRIPVVTGCRGADYGAVVFLF